MYACIYEYFSAQIRVISKSIVPVGPIQQKKPNNGNLLNLQTIYELFRRLIKLRELAIKNWLHW